VRFEIKERCDAVASALSFKNDIVYYLRNNYSTSGVSAEFIVSQFGRERLYSFITAGTAGVGFRTSDSLAFVAARTALGGETFSRDISIDEPACVVSIPERAEFFVSKGAAIFRGRREYYNSLNLAARVTFAEVEISDSLVGEVDGVKAPYNPSYVSQLGEFPRAKYITYFGNRLWVAGITGAPFQVRWSAASPAHKVWPEEAFEELSEDDNSPITALAATDEHLMVFKRDSVWKAVLSKIDDIGIADYDFVKIKSGVGCVSQASIANTPAGLLFLAEDGIYLTDGSRVEKVSQGIQSVVNSLTQAKFKAAAGVHWKKYHAYLLSVSTGGSPTNNLVLVFDYQNGAWWIWDNFEASFWMKEEDSADNERVYFGDADGYIYELGAANHDHYEQINWWVKPHRFGYKDRPSKTFRNLQVGATSDTKNISWELSYNDDERDQNAGTLDFANDVLDSISDGLTGSDELDRELRKGERASLRKTAGWGTLKLESNENTEKAEIHSIELGVVPKGTR
jgi:hypothetical protein